MTPVVREESSPTTTITPEYQRIKLCRRRAKKAIIPATAWMIKEAKSSQRNMLYHISGRRKNSSLTETVSQSIDWLIDWLTNYFNDLIRRLIDWLADWLNSYINCTTRWLIAWLVKRLTVWSRLDTVIQTGKEFEGIFPGQNRKDWISRLKISGVNFVPYDRTAELHTCKDKSIRKTAHHDHLPSDPQSISTGKDNAAVITQYIMKRSYLTGRRKQWQQAVTPVEKNNARRKSQQGKSCLSDFLQENVALKQILPSRWWLISC